MIELTGRLRTVRDVTRDAAEDLRARALAVDADPDAMAGHLGSPVFEMLRLSATPTRFREPPAGARLLSGTSGLEIALATVELSRGDAGVLLSVPTPGLAGVIVGLLGDEAQQERFHDRLRGGRTWPFFGMTEARGGSDATAMESRLEKDGAGGWRLFGGKRYIGNAARAGIGVVFARTGRSPLSIRAVLVEPAGLPGWRGARLDSVGLRGAYVSELRFEGVPVTRDMLLGEHLPVTRRGMWGAITTFHHMRIQVAASAVGTALAMTEYVAEHRKSAPGLDLARARAVAGRELVLEAAAAIDADAERGYPASVVKLAVNRLVADTARWSVSALGPAGLLEHPLLDKWVRDSLAFELMEGTTNIQRLHVAKGFQAGEADRDGRGAAA